MKRWHALLFFLLVFVLVPFLAALGWSASAIMIAILLMAGGIYATLPFFRTIKVRYERLAEAALQRDPTLAQKEDTAIPITPIPLVLVGASLLLNILVGIIAGAPWWVISLFANIVLGNIALVFAFDRLKQAMPQANRLTMLFHQLACVGGAFGTLPLILATEGMPTPLLSFLTAADFALLAAIIASYCLVKAHASWYWRFLQALFSVWKHGYEPRQTGIPVKQEEDSTPPYSAMAGIQHNISVQVVASFITQEEKAVPSGNNAYAPYEQGYSPAVPTYQEGGQTYSYPQPTGAAAPYEVPQAQYPQQMPPP